MHSNSLARHFSPMFHAKCLLPRLYKLLPVRSVVQNKSFKWHTLDIPIYLLTLHKTPTVRLHKHESFFAFRHDEYRPPEYGIDPTTYIVLK